jgi:two-component system phosphate regulon sensor histidine kinase PhoR
VVPFGIEERLLISRNVTQVEAVRAHARDFIANVSHELKAPLTVVAGFLRRCRTWSSSRASARAICN